jgi:uncharacterized protein (DUF1330 family)
MTAYIIFTRERIRDEDEFKTYSSKSGGTLAGHDVKPLVAYNRCETLEGAPIEGAVVLQFPSMEAAKAWYNSDAYTEARRHRFASADYRCFVTEGF